MMPFLIPVTVKPGEGPIAAKPAAKPKGRKDDRRRLETAPYPKLVSSADGP
jgi:hypothetical protein